MGIGSGFDGSARRGGYRGVRSAARDADRVDQRPGRLAHCLNWDGAARYIAGGTPFGSALSGPGRLAVEVKPDVRPYRVVHGHRNWREPEDGGEYYRGGDAAQSATRPPPLGVTLDAGDAAGEKRERDDSSDDITGKAQKKPSNGAVQSVDPVEYAIVRPAGHASDEDWEAELKGLAYCIVDIIKGMRGGMSKMIGYINKNEISQYESQYMGVMNIVNGRSPETIDFILNGGEDKDVNVRMCTVLSQKLIVKSSEGIVNCNNEFLEHFNTVIVDAKINPDTAKYILLALSALTSDSYIRTNLPYTTEVVFKMCNIITGIRPPFVLKFTGDQDIPTEAVFVGKPPVCTSDTDLQSGLTVLYKKAGWIKANDATTAADVPSQTGSIPPGPSTPPESAAADDVVQPLPEPATTSNSKNGRYSRIGGVRKVSRTSSPKNNVVINSATMLSVVSSSKVYASKKHLPPFVREIGSKFFGEDIPVTDMTVNVDGKKTAHYVKMYQTVVEGDMRHITDEPDIQIVNGKKVEDDALRIDEFLKKSESIDPADMPGGIASKPAGQKKRYRHRDFHGYIMGVKPWSGVGDNTPMRSIMGITNHIKVIGDNDEGTADRLVGSFPVVMPRESIFHKISLTHAVIKWRNDDQYPATWVHERSTMEIPPILCPMNLDDLIRIYRSKGLPDLTNSRTKDDYWFECRCLIQMCHEQCKNASSPLDPAERNKLHIGIDRLDHYMHIVVTEAKYIHGLISLLIISYVRPTSVIFDLADIRRFVDTCLMSVYAAFHDMYLAANDETDVNSRNIVDTWAGIVKKQFFLFAFTHIVFAEIQRIDGIMVIDSGVQEGGMRPFSADDVYELAQTVYASLENARETFRGEGITDDDVYAYTTALNSTLIGVEGFMSLPNVMTSFAAAREGLPCDIRADFPFFVYGSRGARDNYLPTLESVRARNIQWAFHGDEKAQKWYMASGDVQLHPFLPSTRMGRSVTNARARIFKLWYHTMVAVGLHAKIPNAPGLMFDGMRQSLSIVRHYIGFIYSDNIDAYVKSSIADVTNSTGNGLTEDEITAMEKTYRQEIIGNYLSAFGIIPLECDGNITAPEGCKVLPAFETHSASAPAFESALPAIISRALNLSVKSGQAHALKLFGPHVAAGAVHLMDVTQFEATNIMYHAHGQSAVRMPEWTYRGTAAYIAADIVDAYMVYDAMRTPSAEEGYNDTDTTPVPLPDATGKSTVPSPVNTVVSRWKRMREWCTGSLYASLCEGSALHSIYRGSEHLLSLQGGCRIFTHAGKVSTAAYGAGTYSRYAHGQWMDLLPLVFRVAMDVPAFQKYRSDVQNLFSSANGVLCGAVRCLETIPSGRRGAVTAGFMALVGVANLQWIGGMQSSTGGNSRRVTHLNRSIVSSIYHRYLSALDTQTIRDIIAVVQRMEDKARAEAVNGGGEKDAASQTQTSSTLMQILNDLSAIQRDYATDADRDIRRDTLDVVNVYRPRLGRTLANGAVGRAAVTVLMQALRAAVYYYDGARGPTDPGIILVDLAQCISGMLLLSYSATPIDLQQSFDRVDGMNAVQQFVFQFTKLSVTAVPIILKSLWWVVKTVFAVGKHALKFVLLGPEAEMLQDASRTVKSAVHGFRTKITALFSCVSIAVGAMTVYRLDHALTMLSAATINMSMMDTLPTVPVLSPFLQRTGVSGWLRETTTITVFGNVVPRGLIARLLYASPPTAHGGGDSDVTWDQAVRSMCISFGVSMAVLALHVATFTAVYRRIMKYTGDVTRPKTRMQDGNNVITPQLIKRVLNMYTEDKRRGKRNMGAPLDAVDGTGIDEVKAAALARDVADSTVPPDLLDGVCDAVMRIYAGAKCIELLRDRVPVDCVTPDVVAGCIEGIPDTRELQEMRSMVHTLLSQPLWELGALVVELEAEMRSIPVSAQFRDEMNAVAALYSNVTAVAMAATASTTDDGGRDDEGEGDAADGNSDGGDSDAGTVYEDAVSEDNGTWWMDTRLGTRLHASTAPASLPSIPSPMSLSMQGTVADAWHRALRVADHVVDVGEQCTAPPSQQPLPLLPEYLASYAPLADAPEERAVVADLATALLNPPPTVRHAYNSTYLKALMHTKTQGHPHARARMAHALATAAAASCAEYCPHAHRVRFHEAVAVLPWSQALGDAGGGWRQLALGRVLEDAATRYNAVMPYTTDNARTAWVLNTLLHAPAASPVDLSREECTRAIRVLGAYDPQSVVRDLLPHVGPAAAQYVAASVCAPPSPLSERLREVVTPEFAARHPGAAACLGDAIAATPHGVSHIPRLATSGVRFTAEKLGMALAAAAEGGKWGAVMDVIRAMPDDAASPTDFLMDARALTPAALGTILMQALAADNHDAHRVVAALAPGSAARLQSDGTTAAAVSMMPVLATAALRPHSRTVPMLAHLHDAGHSVAEPLRTMMCALQGGGNAGGGGGSTERGQRLRAACNALCVAPTYAGTQLQSPATADAVVAGVLLATGMAYTDHPLGWPAMSNDDMWDFVNRVFPVDRPQGRGAMPQMPTDGDVMPENLLMITDLPKDVLYRILFNLTVQSGDYRMVDIFAQRVPESDAVGEITVFLGLSGVEAARVSAVLCNTVPKIMSSSRMVELESLMYLLIKLRMYDLAIAVMDAAMGTLKDPSEYVIGANGMSVEYSMAMGRYSRVVYAAADALRHHMDSVRFRHAPPGHASLYEAEYHQIMGPWLDRHMTLAYSTGGGGVDIQQWLHRMTPLASIVAAARDIRMFSAFIGMYHNTPTAWEKPRSMIEAFIAHAFRGGLPDEFLSTLNLRPPRLGERDWTRYPANMGAPVHMASTHMPVTFMYGENTVMHMCRLMTTAYLFGGNSVREVIDIGYNPIDGITKPVMEMLSYAMLLPEIEPPGVQWSKSKMVIPTAIDNAELMPYYAKVFGRILYDVGWTDPVPTPVVTESILMILDQRDYARLDFMFRHFRVFPFGSKLKCTINRLRQMEQEIRAKAIVAPGAPIPPFLAVLEETLMSVSRAASDAGIGVNDKVHVNTIFKWYVPEVVTVDLTVRGLTSDITRIVRGLLQYRMRARHIRHTNRSDFFQFDRAIAVQLVTDVVLGMVELQHERLAVGYIAKTIADLYAGVNALLDRHVPPIGHDDLSNAVFGAVCSPEGQLTVPPNDYRLHSALQYMVYNRKYDGVTRIMRAVMSAYIPNDHDQHQRYCADVLAMYRTLSGYIQEQEDSKYIVDEFIGPFIVQQLSTDELAANASIKAPRALLTSVLVFMGATTVHLRKILENVVDVGRRQGPDMDSVCQEWVMRLYEVACLDGDKVGGACELFPVESVDERGNPTAHPVEGGPIPPAYAIKVDDIDFGADGCIYKRVSCALFHCNTPLTICCALGNGKLLENPKYEHTLPDLRGRLSMRVIDLDTAVYVTPSEHASSSMMMETIDRRMSRRYQRNVHIVDSDVLYAIVYGLNDYSLLYNVVVRRRCFPYCRTYACAPTFAKCVEKNAPADIRLQSLGSLIGTIHDIANIAASAMFPAHQIHRQVDTTIEQPRPMATALQRTTPVATAALAAKAPRAPPPARQRESRRSSARSRPQPNDPVILEEIAYRVGAIAEGYGMVYPTLGEYKRWSVANFLRVMEDLVLGLYDGIGVDDWKEGVFASATSYQAFFEYVDRLLLQHPSGDADPPLFAQRLLAAIRSNMQRHLRGYNHGRIACALRYFLAAERHDAIKTILESIADAYDPADGDRRGVYCACVADVFREFARCVRLLPDAERKPCIDATITPCVERLTQANVLVQAPMRDADGGYNINRLTPAFLTIGLAVRVYRTSVFKWALTNIIHAGHVREAEFPGYLRRMWLCMYEQACLCVQHDRRFITMFPVTLSEDGLHVTRSAPYRETPGRGEDPIDLFTVKFSKEDGVSYKMVHDVCLRLDSPYSVSCALGDGGMMAHPRYRITRAAWRAIDGSETVTLNTALFATPSSDAYESMEWDVPLNVLPAHDVRFVDPDVFEQLVLKHPEFTRLLVLADRKCVPRCATVAEMRRMRAALGGVLERGVINVKRDVLARVLDQFTEPFAVATRIVDEAARPQ